MSGTGPVLPDLGTPGQVAGFRLADRIGESNVAVVRLARDQYLDRTVAVKILAAELAGDAGFRARFLAESRAAAAIGHPHIVPLYAAGYTDGILYVVMRHVGGGDARSLLGRLGPLPYGRAWGVIAQVASALDAAHGQGLIHRDVKPANMLLEADCVAGGKTANGVAGERASDGAADSGAGHVYLSDFGMGRDLSPGGIIAAGQFAGALNYLAPEQIQGRALDGRADLYSLACAGFELLCGTPPFGQNQGLTVMYAQLYAQPPAATERRPDLPAGVDPVLARALAKNPADRHQTCGQFAEDLRTALGLLPDGSDDPARLRSPGHARSAAEPGRPRTPEGRPPQNRPPEHRTPQNRPRKDGPPEDRPPEDRTPQNQPPEDRTPQNRLPEDGPPEDPGRVSPDPASAPGRRSRPPRHRSTVIVAILALAAAGTAAAVTIAVVPARPAQGRQAVPSPTAHLAPSSSPASASSAPAPPPASTLAPEQAAAVNDLLRSSAATRQALQGAVGAARDCTDLSSAVSQIQNAVNQRGSEYNRASALSTSALADGAILKADLTVALRSSLDADKDYLAWARQLSLGCVPAAQSSAYNAAYGADEQANAAKEAFIQVWDPVAARYGIQQESPGSF